MGSQADLLTLRSSIFPVGPPRDGHIVRTEYVATWASQFVGLGRLTAFNTEQLPKRSAAFDDIGLSLLFLQRHRAEVALKLVLERCGSAIPNSHDLRTLAADCEVGMSSTELSKEWADFARDHGPLLDLLADVDPGSYAFRYPVNTSSQPVSRPQFVDLVKLEEEGAKLHAAVEDLVDVIAYRAGLELPVAEVEPAAIELAMAIEAIDSLVAGKSEMEARVASVGEELTRRKRETSERAADAFAGANDQMGVLIGLKRQLARYRQLLEARLGEPISDYPRIPSEDVGPFPDVSAADLFPGDPKRFLEPQMRWSARMIGSRTRDLGNTLYAVRARAEGWPGPAAAQLRADIDRTLSRMFRKYPRPSNRSHPS